MPRKAADLTGRTVGVMTVLHRENRGPEKHPRWIVRCQCGNEKSISSSSLIRGTLRSCGCLKSLLVTASKTRHGHANKNSGRSKTYKVWIAMRRRCSDQTSGSYSRYGALGITVCDEWKESFDRFLSDMGECPSDLHQIDRIDPRKGYSADNCRWATRLEQRENRKRGLNTEKVLFIRQNPEMKLKELAEMFSVTESLISQVRLRRAWADI